MAFLLKNIFHRNSHCWKNSIAKFRSSAVDNGFPGFKIEDKLHSRQSARDFIFKLSCKDRTILLEELQRFQVQAEAIRESTESSPPSSAQLRSLAAHSAMPFIGFGFLDNLIMILAGDYIDATIGITLGISTMAAAGMGNTLSDVAGIGSAWYVEKIACKIGVRAPSLSPPQMAMSRSRMCIHFGRALGVTIGCILGMFPLLFRRKKDTDNEDESSD